MNRTIGLALNGLLVHATYGSYLFAIVPMYTCCRICVTLECVNQRVRRRDAWAGHRTGCTGGLSKLQHASDSVTSPYSKAKVSYSPASSQSAEVHFYNDISVTRIVHQKPVHIDQDLSGCALRFLAVLSWLPGIYDVRALSTLWRMTQTPSR